MKRSIGFLLFLVSWSVVVFAQENCTTPNHETLMSCYKTSNSSDVDLCGFLVTSYLKAIREWSDCRKSAALQAFDREMKRIDSMAGSKIDAVYESHACIVGGVDFGNLSCPPPIKRKH